MRKPVLLPTFAALGLSAAALVANPGAASAVTVGPGLQSKLAALLNPTDSAGVVIITFDTANGLAGVPNLDTPVTGLLAANGIIPAARLEALGILTAVLTKSQVNALKNDPRVLSLYDNYKLKYTLHQARILCGVDRLRADAGMTSRNGGKVVDGAGDGAPTPATATDPAQPNRPSFSVVVIDSGIDTTGVPNASASPDLQYDNSSAGVLDPSTTPPVRYARAPITNQLLAPTIPNTKIIQNVQVVGSATGTITYSENLLSNDSVGHGSHCAGIVGGLGTFSKTTAALTGPNASPTGSNIGTFEDFSGAASGVKIIGCGSGAGLFVLDAMGGMNYAINFQSFYNVRITSNSYGSTGDYDPADPLNVTIKAAYDRNITTVFAAGNSGPGVDTTSNNSKSPYVINVAAGTKEGGLASFSSRGKPAAERTGPNARPIDAYNLPAITAPGTGREFEYNAPGNATGKHLYNNIISTRSKVPGAAAGTEDTEFPAPYQANYTAISGTSMACPFIAGACALLLDADPSLTPDSAHPLANGRKGLKEILQATATRMPDFQDFEVGAGYVNVYAAVDLALAQAANTARSYVPFNRVDAPYKDAYTPFNVNVTSTLLAPTGRPTGYPPATLDPNDTPAKGELFTLDYSPQGTNSETYEAAKTKAQTNNNAIAFLVDANADGTPIAGLAAALRTTVLDFRISFGNDSAAGIAGGNSIGVLLYAPDGTTYSSGIALPVLDAPTRQVVVKSPVPGLWVAELRGLRGLAAVPVTPPTGAGLPDTTIGTILRTNELVVNPPGDISDAPQRSAINQALLFRYMDTQSGGSFGPKVSVTRGELAQVLADNAPLRQTLGATARFTDVSGNLSRIAEAVSVSGSTLRDHDFSPPALMPTTGTTFRPDFLVQRIEVATALVRALGLDTEAKTAPPATVTVTNNGNTYPIVDARELNAASRGYLQYALNKGLVDYTLAPGVFNGANQTVAYARPNKTMSRGELAQGVVNFRGAFRAGN